MDEGNRVRLLSRAIQHYGKTNQLHVAIEEMSELQKELCKDLRAQGQSELIAEEVADVEIMLEQIKLMYSFDDRVSYWKNFKLARLKRRIEQGG